MIKLKQNTRTFGDETAGYAVELTKEYTVQEFVNEVVSNKREWGYIGISCGRATFGNPNCEYKLGKLLSELPSEIMTKKIASAKASGGWSRMDYLLELT